MMHSNTYIERRQQLTDYFDKTATQAWTALTSNRPVNRVRQTVRAGRDSMREQLLAWLPEDLSGRRILDAGCGTGSLAVEAARRGADVVAIDIAENLIEVAKRRATREIGTHSIEFLSGDMCSDELGRFDHIVAMDSLIHYESADIVDTIQRLCRRTERSVLFTFAPSNVALSTMHFVGRLIPHASNRAPSIVPIAEQPLRRQLTTAFEGRNWSVSQSARIKSGFYISQAMELRRACAD